MTARRCKTLARFALALGASVVVLGISGSLHAQGHSFPSADIFVAQARANDIVCRDSTLKRIPPHGSDAWIELQHHETLEFCNQDTIVSHYSSAYNYVSSALNDLYEGRLRCPANAVTKPP